MKSEDENIDGGRGIAFLITLMTVACLGVLLSIVVYVKLINPPHGKKMHDSGMAQMKEALPVTYTALGDSTGVGVGAQAGGGYVARLFKRINEARPGSKLTNVCVSGATTGDVLRDQVETALNARPTLITLGIGINDVGHQMNVETFARNYEMIIVRLKRANVPIVITNIPDVSLAPVVPPPARAEVARRITLFNERISKIASRYGLLVVDAFKATHEVIPSHPEFFSDDGFHPSDKGYEYWAEAMWPTVKKAVGE
jgi:acyl-CoA thioesterase I